MSAPEAAEPPTPPAEADELSYKRRLEGPPAAESLKPPAPVRRAALRPARSRRSPQRPLRRPRRRPRQATIGTPQPGTWVIQIHVASRSHAPPTASSAALPARGIRHSSWPPDLRPAPIKVQVGRYKDRDEAQKVIDRLKKEEQFNPWITR